MTSTAAPVTYATRLAGWSSGLVIAVTFTFLQSAYQRLPLLVPVRFEDGNPIHFAFKSPALVFLPVALQVSLAAIFTVVVALLVRRERKMAAGDTRRDLGAVRAAEGIALLASVWISFQAVNAWRLTAIYRHAFDASLELYTVAAITAITATIVIVARAVLQVRECEDEDGARLSVLPVVAGQHALASAALAAALGAGLAVPFYLVAAAWGGLRHI